MGEIFRDNRAGATIRDDVANEVADIDISRIAANPEQPRREFDSHELEGLSKSILTDGVIQPILVTKSTEGAGQYILLAGERRLRASKLAGLTSIPAIVKTTHRSEWLRVALVENIQRQDLNCIEEAQSYSTLINEYRMSQDELSKQVGKNRTTISNYLRLLSLPQVVQRDLIDKKLTVGHAKALASLSEPGKVLAAREIILKKGLNVRAAESFCKSLQSSNQPPLNDRNELGVQRDLDYIADQLRNDLKTRVKILGSGSRGKIEISFFSSSDLERLLKRIKSFEV